MMSPYAKEEARRSTLQTKKEQDNFIKARYDRIQESAAIIKKKFSDRLDKCRVAIILGSGMGGFAKTLEKPETIDYEDAKWGTTTIEGHAGKLHLGRIPKSDIDILCMQGRIHFYETNDMDQVTRPIRVFKELGVEAVFITNATGGMNPKYKVGDYMIVKDHISLLPNPCTGPNMSKHGPRFHDMSKPYDPELRKLIKLAAKEEGVEEIVQEGVLIAVTGPSYETPAEIRCYSRLGADNVGMSVTHEATVARHCGLRCAAMSAITNMAAGVTDAKLNHDEVQEVTASREPIFNRLMANTLRRIHESVSVKTAG